MFTWAGQRYDLGEYKLQGAATVACELGRLLASHFIGGETPPSTGFGHDLATHPDVAVLLSLPTLEAALRKLHAEGLPAYLYLELEDAEGEAGGTDDDEPLPAVSPGADAPLQGTPTPTVAPPHSAVPRPPSPVKLEPLRGQGPPTAAAVEGAPPSAAAALPVQRQVQVAPQKGTPALPLPPRAPPPRPTTYWMEWPEDSGAYAVAINADNLPHASLTFRRRKTGEK